MRTRLWLLIGLLFLAVATRLYRLPDQSIWFDEGWSAYAAVQPTLQVAVAADSTNPPLYYILLNIAARAFGDSEFSLRYVSLLFGILAVPLSYCLGRRLFSPPAGLGAAFLVSFSPLLWWASQEARMYTLLALLVLVAALAWSNLRYRSARWAWLVLWASELALLYAHNTGPVIALWLNSVTLMVWLVHRSARRPDWRLWLSGQAAVALLWSPWFVTRFLLLPEANSALRAAPQVGLELLGQLWGALWLGAWPMVIQPQADLALYAPLMLALIFVAALLLIPWRKSAAYWLLAHVAILTIALVLGLRVLGNELHGRYLVMIAPLFLTLVGVGIGEKSMTGLRSFVVRPLRYGVAAVFLVAFVGSVHFLTTNPAYQHDDARGMVQYYAGHLTGDDTVLAWSYADRYELAYYWDRLGVAARRITLPEGADLDQILPLLPTGGDVALNIWYTQRADYRGMMSCLLGNGTVNEPERVAFYGMSNELYYAPALDLPDLRPFDARIGGIAHITALASLPSTIADQALCLPVQIRLLAQTAADLKAALIVHNALGWEVARDDAPFADAAQRTTALREPGAMLAAYPLLRLPYGAPPGEYPVFLRVYDEVANPSGYDLLLPDTPRPVRDMPLGVWTVRAGADWENVNRSADLSAKRDLPLRDDLRLIADDIQGGTFRNGDQLRFSLLWAGSGTLPDLTLVSLDAGWSLRISPSSANPKGNVTLDWRAAQIPLDAPSGGAELRLPDGTALATYTIESIPPRYDQPSFVVPLGVDFPGVGRLVGYTLAAGSLVQGSPFDVALVWYAEGAAPVSYTVFVQLIDAGGQVIAQADSIPAASARPTTGWRAGEYIVDIQRLTFNASAQPGRVRLVAGLYDAVTGARVPLASGEDFVTLADDIELR